MAQGIRRNEMTIADDAEAEYGIEDLDGLFSTNFNAIPMPKAVQVARNFYGSRFFEQALPLVEREAPLVRNLNTETGRSWDYLLGKHVGAQLADDDDEGGVVDSVDADQITWKLPDGRVKTRELYNLFPGNRSTLQHNTPKVKPGDTIHKGQLLASSNFTDDEGRMAMGRNVRVGLGPYRGASMDDAVVISNALANRMTSEHAETVDREPDEILKLGKGHYVSLFPKKFNNEQLEKLDADGIALPGQIIQPGDPLALQTKPRSFSSNKVDVGRLSRSQRFVRRDAALVWEGDDPAEVIDVGKTKEGGHKFLLRYHAPVRPGDKLTIREGQKMTVSKILPDEKMPRTEDGQPLEMLLNPLSLPSRVNVATFHELVLGKIAQNRGKAYTLPSFLPKGQKWNEFVRSEAAAHGVNPNERVYDPEEDRFLDNPLTVGIAHVLRLHHRAGKKMSVRGQNSYTQDFLPMKGHGQGAQRMSGLEMNVLHSSGARGVQREALLLRGSMNDDYWRQLRNNRTPGKLDRPFVWDKFQALLAGSGIHAKDLGHGRLRLVPMTGDELMARGAEEIKNDGIVDINTWEPKPGGLFDPRMVKEQKWGFVKLREPVVNPSYEDTVRALLGLTKAQYEEILDRD